MRAAALVTIIFCSFMCSASAAQSVAAPDASKPPDAEAGSGASATHDAAEVGASNKDAADFCFFAGTPPNDVPYAKIRKVKAGKGTYGGVKDILPKLVDTARRIGADAIIDFEGSQRFGVFPWRIVRPVVRGVAIKWTDHKPHNCAAMGGTTLATILATNEPPAG